LGPMNGHEALLIGVRCREEYCGEHRRPREIDEREISRLGP
jgi:hypothetical protein